MCSCYTSFQYFPVILTLTLWVVKNGFLLIALICDAAEIFQTIRANRRTYAAVVAVVEGIIMGFFPLITCHGIQNLVPRNARVPVFSG